MPRKKKDEVELDKSKEVTIDVPEGFNLAKDIPVINNHKQLELWLRPMYIIDDYLQDKDKYDDLMKRLMNLLRASFDIYECRTLPVKFKFYKNDKKEYALEFRHFIINMILWYPMTVLADYQIMDDSFIMQCNPDIIRVNSYINEKIIFTLIDHMVKAKTINKALENVIYNLSLISIDFSEVMGLNYHLKTFIDLYKTNETARNIMETRFDRTMQPYEIEKSLQEKQEQFIDILMSDPNNPLGVILRSGVGIKHKQLTEFAINSGLKPTLTGETIPIPARHSILMGGADTPATYFVNSIGSRKSLVMQKKVINMLVTAYSDVCA